MPPPDSAEARWFAQHVQPHEAMLRAWLQSRFPAECDIDDVIQEAYLKVLQVHAAQSIDSPKAFLFAIARNLALGRMRHNKVRAENSLTENDALAILDENVDVPMAVARAQELELLTQAIQSLPPRCRQILTLRKLYGLSQKEVAAQLGIAEHTVEAQGVIGLRKIAEFFARYDRKGPDTP